MDDQIGRLVNKAWAKFQQMPKDQRLLIAIGGIPGSGKTTISRTITSTLSALNAIHCPSQPCPAAFVPMDGFHLTRAQLSAMPDPITAFARRGAEFTFDGQAFLSLVQSLRAPLSPTTGMIYAPSFDHALKDPRANDIAIAPHHRIIVFEGNYVVLDKEPWRSAAALMDERWFVECEFGLARERLVKRHVLAGIAPNEEEAGKRADENDLVNGREIVDNKVGIDEVVVSREVQVWTGPGWRDVGGMGVRMW